MAKNRDELEAECRSTVKLILVEMEELAAMPPERAAEPYSFDARRRRVIRKIHGLFKEAVNYDPGEVQRAEHRQQLGDVPRG